jgi:glycosyltransferase involved in cell wall biosynthesis
MPNAWHLVTGEYPPGCGGVGDYTAALAGALAGAGDTVHVWTPATPASSTSRGVTLHVLPDAFGPASRRAMAAAWSEHQGVVLLQYVAHALGARGANLAFCRWFSRQRPHVADLRVMIHEPYFYFTPRRPWAPGNALALAQRLMARLVVGAASRVYFSTDTWSRYIRSTVPPVTLPIPSSIPAAPSADAVVRARRAASGGVAVAGAPLVGHFGTYGAHGGTELMAMLPALVERVPDVRVALVGDGGPAFVDRLRDVHPGAARQVWAPGRLDAADVATALAACDLLLQPYPDGITTRRTSVMAGLRNGVPIVSTRGALTEPVWDDTRAIAMATAGDVCAHVDLAASLLRDADARAALGARGGAVYRERFSMEHTIAILRDPAAA